MPTVFSLKNSIKGCILVALFCVTTNAHAAIIRQVDSDGTEIAGWSGTQILPVATFSTTTLKTLQLSLRTLSNSSQYFALKLYQNGVSRDCYTASSTNDQMRLIQDATTKIPVYFYFSGTQCQVTPNNTYSVQFFNNSVGSTNYYVSATNTSSMAYIAYDTVEQETSNYIGDQTRIVDLVQPQYKLTYEATSTVPFQILVYQSIEYQRADTYKVRYTSLSTNTSYEFTGDLNASLGGEQRIVEHHVLPEASQYTCVVSIYADEVTYAFGVVQENVEIDNWVQCRFNLDTNTPFPNEGYNPNLDGSQSLATSSDPAGSLTEFFNTLFFDKHPFAWALQTITVVKLAASYQQTSDPFTLQLDLAPGIRNSTTTAVLIPELDAQDLMFTFGEEQICYIQVEAFTDNVCNVFRTIITYALWVTFALGIVLSLRKFLETW